MKRLILISVCCLACRTEGDLKVGEVDAIDTGGETASPIDTSDSAIDTGPLDADGDGHPATEDCDDTNPEVSPSADETCNGIDDDCDEEIDEDDAADALTWYSDIDSDGWGDSAHSSQACQQPEGHSSAGGDCNDQDPRYHPAAVEDDCTDPNDYNCDGSVGWADDDGDGWAACQDCDDSDRTVNPSAIEVCDGIDNDCDATTDGPTAVGVVEFFADSDADGFGNASQSTLDCTAPSGHVLDSTDCDDTNTAVNPAATEVCNDVDDDCDGSVDEDSAADAETFYLDFDSDGFGTSLLTATACTSPPGYVAADDDCDDTDPAVNPAATEVCNGVDDDCDGDTDSTAVDRLSFYEDADCDGDGSSTTQLSCTSPGAGWVTSSNDCDDTDPLSASGATEICDGVDNNCDGTIDESCTDTHLVPAPSHPAIATVTHPAACALVGETSGGHNSHNPSDLPIAMAILDGTDPGLTDSVSLDTDILDWSVRYITNYTASPGNFSPTTAWPTLSNQGVSGAARMRGYIHIECGAPLHYTIGLLGNDTLNFSIEGQEMIQVHWNDGQWKKYRYITFPEPGLYAFEVQWSTNLLSYLDPFELIWAEGLMPGYQDYDASCSYSSCTYGSGVPIPGFAVVDSSHLLQASDGSATTCEQCATSADCSDQTATCNSAGICE